MIHKVKVYHYCKLVSPFTLLHIVFVKVLKWKDNYSLIRVSYISLKTHQIPPIAYYPNIKHPPRVEDRRNATRPSSPI